MIFAASISANLIPRRMPVSAPPRVNVPSSRLDALYPAAIACSGQNFKPSHCPKPPVFTFPA